MMKLKVFVVAGARPNFMKIAPIGAEMRRHEGLEPLVIHAGQHRDYLMSDVFFRQLDIPAPRVVFNSGPGSHARQTARVLVACEEACLAHRPDLVLVVGDVNSTLACALAAAKLNIPVAHVEAGLRSGDRTMPEEINRRLTDALADLHFTTCRDAGENLAGEGIARNRVHFVGNPMIDTLLRFRPRAEAAGRLKIGSGYALLTLHRPANVDDRAVLTGILDALDEIARRLPVIFPAHPRTTGRIAEFGLRARFRDLDPGAGAVRPGPGIHLLPPLPYLDMLALMMRAQVVLTDSGGVQEETTALGVPCLTLRENTERPVTVTEGTNTLVGTDPAAVIAAVDDVLATGGKRGRLPELWDGRAAERLVAVILERFSVPAGREAR